MRVVVTRPQREAAPWLEALRARGLETLALPLIEIRPAADAAALQKAREALPGYAAAMFVSANAVNHFSEANRPAERTNSAWAAIKTRAWATGPGTRQALLDCGWPAAQVDAPPDDAPRFDSEALWQGVASQVTAGDRVLVVRGGDAAGNSSGRDWLADQLLAAGAVVDRVVAYTRHAPRFGAQEADAARQAAADGSAWLFSSSEAIANLLAWLPRQQWAAARAVATHPRIAQAARDAGFGVVCESRPALADVVASIESLR
ncbi:MAG: uroporphyrinogen-III synthase [Burkholderiales bacterium]|nr:uroporphyrinogen-III synthase [Burkholderiales bacterium]